MPFVCQLPLYTVVFHLFVLLQYVIIQHPYGQRSSIENMCVRLCELPYACSFVMVWVDGSGNARFDVIRSARRHIRLKMLARLNSFSFTVCFVRSAWALATFHLKKKLIVALAREAALRSGKFKVQDIANTAWATREPAGGEVARGIGEGGGAALERLPNAVLRQHGVGHGQS